MYRLKWTSELTEFIRMTCGMEMGSELYNLYTALPNHSMSADDMCVAAAHLRDGFGFPWPRTYDYGQWTGVFQKFRIAEELMKTGHPSDEWLPPLKIPAPYSHLKSNVVSKREVFLFSDSSLCSTKPGTKTSEPVCCLLEKVSRNMRRYRAP